MVVVVGQWEGGGGQGGPSSGYQEPKLEGPRVDSLAISGRVVKVWNTLSLGLSHKKKLLVPLQVSKHSVSLRISSHPITSPALKPGVLADLSNFLPVCPILLLPCFRAVCVSSSRSAVNFALDLIIPLFFPFNFFLALVFFLSTPASCYHPLFFSAFSLHLLAVCPSRPSTPPHPPPPPGQAWVYTYHAQVDGRVGLWHGQIVERMEHVVQVIFLGGEKQTRENEEKNT